MTKKFTDNFSKHIDFEYTRFDRIILRGYILRLFVEGSVIKLLRNVGSSNHSNGVLKLLTEQLNAHIKKISDTICILKQQFDLQHQTYTMKDNSFTKNRKCRITTRIGKSLSTEYSLKSN